MFPAIIAQLWLEPVRSNNEYLSDYLFCRMDICAWWTLVATTFFRQISLESVAHFDEFSF